MQFPKDAVLVKTISLDCIAGKKRVETQILHCDGEDWPATRTSGGTTRATLTSCPPDGSEKLFTVADDRIRGGKREQMWTFHSRTQCISCHNAWAEYALAFNPVQLNGRCRRRRGRTNSCT